VSNGDEQKKKSTMKNVSRNKVRVPCTDKDEPQKTDINNEGAKKSSVELKNTSMSNQGKQTPRNKKPHTSQEEQQHVKVSNGDEQKKKTTMQWFSRNTVPCTDKDEPQNRDIDNKGAKKSSVAQGELKNAAKRNQNRQKPRNKKPNASQEEPKHVERRL
jgi:hypothetical protein